jgi:phosphate transport system ATP-binding protein
MPHISIQNLNVSYGKHRALNNINLTIPDGQIIAIIGPSGCGKTTLLKSMNRLLDLYDDVTVKGKVLIDGTNIYEKKADILALRKKVGFLSQRPYPLPMSIYDNIAFGPKIHGIYAHKNFQKNLKEVQDTGKKEMDALVEHYLRLAGLWDEVHDRLNSPATKLSVGQQQRLALARALAVEPEVVLADEPTSALDPISAKLVENQFHFLKTDYTFIVVTHILRQARRLADYVLFMYMGDLVEHGPAKEIFAQQKDERTRAYMTGEIS